jgi:hypothetical protein
MGSLVLGFALALTTFAHAGDEASAPPSVSAAEVILPRGPLERADASLVAEARAMADLVVVLKKEVREGRLDLTTEGKLAWQAGVVDFDNVQARGRVGDWRTAYLAAIEARTSVLRGADEAFSVRTADPVKLALQAYIDAVEPRVEAARQLVRANGRNDLDKRWLEARELFQEAKTLTSVDRFQKAWGALVVSAGKLDQLVLQSVWGWRPETE